MAATHCALHAVCGTLTGATTAALTVDRLEGDVAVVELPDGTTIDLPTALLPPNTQEGSILRLVLDHDSTGARRAEAEARLARLREQEEEVGDNIVL